LAPGSLQGCCLNPNHATGQLQRAEVIGVLHWRELDRAEQTLITVLITRFEGQASEVQLTTDLGCPGDLLYEVAAPHGRHAAQISGCLYEQERFTVTDQARDVFLTQPES
jgi:hypothetical protein